MRAHHETLPETRRRVAIAAGRRRRGVGPGRGGTRPRRQKPAVLLLADAKDDLPTLARRLAAEGYRVERSDQSGIPAGLERFHTVVVYVHQPLVPGVETALIDYARGGGRLVVLHHAIASAKMANPRWLAFLGISLAPRDAAKYPWHVSGGVTLHDGQPRAEAFHHDARRGLREDGGVRLARSGRPEGHVSGVRPAANGSLPQPATHRRPRQDDPVRLPAGFPPGRRRRRTCPGWKTPPAGTSPRARAGPSTSSPATPSTISRTWRSRGSS